MNEAESADQIDEAAFAWVARLDRYGPTAVLEQELEAWLAQDPRRRGAFLRAQALWGRLDRASQAEEPRRVRVRIDRRLALAAGTALAASVAGLWVMSRETPYATAVGEVRHIPLPDGSGMALNTDSQAQVAMPRSERRVRLAEGEAWFHVAKDPDRPFIVEAGRVRVRAVGTAFSVRRLDNGAEVLVSEGVVEAWLVGSERGKVRIGAGQKARVLEGAPALIETAASEIDRKLAWRSEKIDLEGETLAEAIAEFNRFNRRKLVLTDAALAGRRLYGVFRADDPEAFARSAALSLSAQVRIDPDRIAIGGPRPQPARI
jgi:transmembrane sensor